MDDDAERGMGGGGDPVAPAVGVPLDGDGAPVECFLPLLIRSTHDDSAILFTASPRGLSIALKPPGRDEGISVAMGPVSIRGLSRYLMEAMARYGKLWHEQQSDL